MEKPQRPPGRGANAHLQQLEDGGGDGADGVLVLPQHLQGAGQAREAHGAAVLQRAAAAGAAILDVPEGHGWDGRCGRMGDRGGEGVTQCGDLDIVEFLCVVS